jgi:outer membrane receptor protein involved in Fe transport
MRFTFSPFRVARLFGAAALLLTLWTALTASAADDAKKSFNVPAGAAAQTLKQFATQASREIVFAPDTVSGVTTRAVEGEFTPSAALEQMLSGTGLVAAQEPKTGAFAVRKGSSPEKNGASPAAIAKTTADGPTVAMDAFAITGSRIKRLEGEGPQPVASYAQKDIEDRGFLNTGDFLQSLSFNSGTVNSPGVPAVNPVSNVPYARGAVTINPRGLGAGRFLVLLDGKRPASYGLPDNRGGAVFDFNSIPTEAIASIEYLKDGASAIYGTDAIAGVMNVRLRSNYSGFSTSATVGDTLGHDTLTRSLSLLTGDSTKKGSYLLNVNWFKQNSNFAVDYDRSQTTDYSSFGAVKGQNNNSPSNFPFNLTLTAAQAAAAGFTNGAGFYVITGGAPTASPSIGSFSYAGANQNAASNANRYDFARLTQLTPDQENFSLMFNVKRQLNELVRASIQILANQNRTGIVYTPISINSQSIANADGSFLTIPGNNPYNPFGVALNNFRGRGNFGPTRTFNVETTGSTSILGLEGKLPGEWEWATDLIYGNSLFDQVANNQKRTSDMQAALNGTLAGFNGQFFNPFGPSANPALVNSLFVTSTANSRSTTLGYDVSATGPLFAMPALGGIESAGNVALAVGAEQRKDTLDNHSDPVGYLVSIGDLPYSGNRRVTSFYAEAALPVLPRYLTFQVAGRYDRYNTFGSTVNPKYAVVSQPVDFLKLRASYSTSFKAPDIGQLYQPAVTTFTTAIADPLNPAAGTNTYPFVASGNRNLQPEKGRVWYGGAVLDLNKWVKGLSFSADYFDIELRNVITSFTTPTTFFNFFPSRVIRNSAGTIQYFDAKTINAAGYKWQGLDLGADYRLNRTFLGDFNFSGQVTYTDYFALNAGAGLGYVNSAGRYNNPRLAGSAQLGWKKGKLGATLGTQFKGHYLMDQFAPAWGENAQFLFNGTVSIDTIWRTKVTLGCNNLLDADAPQNGKAIPSYGFDIATYPAWSLGRFVYVKIKKDF